MLTVKSGMVVHLQSQLSGTKAGGSQSELSLGNLVRLCLKIQNKKGWACGSVSLKAQS